MLCRALFVYLAVYFIFCSLAAFCHANFTIKLNWIELSNRCTFVIQSVNTSHSISSDWLDRLRASFWLVESSDLRNIISEVTSSRVLWWNVALPISHAFSRRVNGCRLRLIFPVSHDGLSCQLPWQQVHSSWNFIHSTWYRHSAAAGDASGGNVSSKSWMTDYRSISAHQQHR